MSNLHRAAAVFALFGLCSSSAHGWAPAPLNKRATTPAMVHVVGVYEGTYWNKARFGFRLPQQGTVTVKVGDVKGPVILVLTSYEPVLWQVEAPRGTVVQVIASGYYKQAVEGLNRSVPVTLISYEGKDREYFYAYRKEARLDESDHEREETKRKYDRLVERVKALTGRGITNFQGTYSGDTFEVR
jgi:hypothetical protein